MDRFWDSFTSWDEAEKAWDAAFCKETICDIPHTPPISEKTRRFLPLKSLVWVLHKDKSFKLLSLVLRKPWIHLKNYISSLCRKEKFIQEKDFYFLGIRNEEEWKKKAINSSTIVVVGFSYCQKPLTCPETRFSEKCRADAQHHVCRQCFIGKCTNALSKDTRVLVIPTINYIGKELLRIQKENPTKEILFCITACPLSLQMFADYGAMAGLKGIGVALSGRTCTTMQAFKFAEEGKKPQKTLINPPTERRLLDLFRVFRANC